MSLSPGIPESPHITKVPVQFSRHRRGESYAVHANRPRRPSGCAKNGVAPRFVPPPARDAGPDVHAANPSRERSVCMPVALAIEDCAAVFGDCQNLPAWSSYELLRK